MCDLKSFSFLHHFGSGFEYFSATIIRKLYLASRGGKRAQKNPNNPKSWGAEQKDPILPQ